MRLANWRVDDAAARSRLVLLVDTHVLADVLQSDLQRVDGCCVAHKRPRAMLRALIVNPLIRARVSLSCPTLEALSPSSDSSDNHELNA